MLKALPHIFTSTKNKNGFGGTSGGVLIGTRIASSWLFKAAEMHIQIKLYSGGTNLASQITKESKTDMAL